MLNIKETNIQPCIMQQNILV